MTAIWKQTPTLEQLRVMHQHSAIEHLGIEVVEVGDDFVRGTMPVDERTHQPFGLLHGGASVLLAESLGSLGANLCVDMTKQVCVGLEINANHLRSVRSGTVVGVARPLHIGRSTQVWQIHIYDEKERPVCISRITMAVKDR